MDTSGIFQEMCEKAKEQNPDLPEDYVGEDGLVYCGNCHTRKQFRIPNLTSKSLITIVPVPCDCRKEQMLADEKLRQQKETEKRLASLRTASMMEGTLTEATFEKAQTTKDNAKNMKICRAYAKNFESMFAKNQGLLLMGDVGTGKTYAAACIANYLLDKGTPCIVTSFVRLISLTKPYNGDEANDVENVMLEVPLLIIDDMGAQRDTSYATERVYDFINRRTIANKPMIVTTNITDPKELTGTTNVEDRRIYDRILQHCAPLMFVGKSWRLQEARNRAKEMEKELGL